MNWCRGIFITFVASLWLFAPFSQAFSSPLRSTAVVTDRITPNAKLEIADIQAKTEQLARSRHDSTAWNALWVAAKERVTPQPITETMGTLPEDFPPGALLRIGPNGAGRDEGAFDGDGMIHSITFPPGGRPGTMTSTYVETMGRQLEAAKGKRFFGTLGGVPRGYPLLWSLVCNGINFGTLNVQKDTANTAIAEHGGKILALMEQSPPTEIALHRDGTVQTIQAGTNLNGAITWAPITGGELSAHGRTCPDTGERIHVSYQAKKPYLRMDVFANKFDLKKSVGIDVPSPVFLHDSTITENYVVIMDLPLSLRPGKLLFDKFPVGYEPDGRSRIGLVPRNSNDEPRWFHCEPGIVLHLVNAYETSDNKVKIQGLRSVPRGDRSYLEQFAASYLHEYSIDLETGVLEENCLNPSVIAEFPNILPHFNGKADCPSVYALSCLSIGGLLELHTMPREGLNLGGVVKFALTDSDIWTKGDIIGRYDLPDRWYCVSEPSVIPKTSGSGEYVAMIATHVPLNVSWKDVVYDESCSKSKLVVLDGDNLGAGPVYTKYLPNRIPFGLHSFFLEWDKMV